MQSGCCDGGYEAGQHREETSIVLAAAALPAGQEDVRSGAGSLRSSGGASAQQHDVGGPWVAISFTSGTGTIRRANRVPTRRRIPLEKLSELFEHTLEDIYYAENAIAKALPKVIKAVKATPLKQAIEAHLEETRGQIETLKKVFATIDKKPDGVKCDAIEGLLKEADGLMMEAKGVALDAGLLAAAQAVEHYEISRYGSLREWAKVLGNERAHVLLTEILDQEKAANAKLTTLAVTSVNK
jgi:ferritin-like metal-binding protein YciE